jgi:NAD(P)-dependent dehydrogenase (short-subunit alcohol dehydrogenase family)
MRLDGKIAIVTGAAGGIGRESALAFAREGAQVFGVDVNVGGLEETAQADDRVQAHPCDVSDSAAVEDLVKTVVDTHGRLDAVFSNAAIMRDGSVIDLSEDDWDAMFAANVKGAFLLGKHGIPPMAASGGGSFIITASANSFYAESDIAGYCATKGAAMQLTRAMAVDHGPDGVRVNCICPGWIETPMSLPYLTEQPQSRRFGEQIAPLGRIGQPQDVAAVALFLASDEAAFVTGAAYNVDGGWTAGLAKAVALV